MAIELCCRTVHGRSDVSRQPGEPVHHDAWSARENSLSSPSFKSETAQNDMPSRTQW